MDASILAVVLLFAAWGAVRTARRRAARRAAEAEERARARRRRVPEVSANLRGQARANDLWDQQAAADADTGHAATAAGSRPDG